MVLIIVFIIFFGLMDLLAIITMIQEHRQNKKDYCRGFDDGYQLATRQHQPLKDRWGKLKYYVEQNHNVADEDYAIIYSFVLNKMEELEEGETDGSTN